MVFFAMPIANLLALLDDISVVLDDIAILTKVSTKKTSGVLGDDLALNAEQVSGVRADRELPVVWAVAKGSAKNKAILVPAALVLSALLPWAVTPLLLLGGGYLCFEGFEKLAHKYIHPKSDDDAHRAELEKTLVDPNADFMEVERAKVKGAIRTDFVLSAEIITISLGVVAKSSFAVRISVLVLIAIIMTIGVYGFVAAIVKLDDLGLYLSRIGGQSPIKSALRAVGRGLLRGAPYLMKGLAIAGTLAMFLVGGGIVSHGLPPVHHFAESIPSRAKAIGGTLVGAIAPSLFEGLVGLLTGALILLMVEVSKRAYGRLRATA